jgi:hypothetical protein
MLLQTNSYIVPGDKRAEHARLLRRFRQVLARLGCDQFEVYEQVGSNWNAAEVSGRVVQIMRFRDRKHQLTVQAAERNDPVAQAVIAEFCALINFPYQQQQGLFAVGFYNAVLPVAHARAHAAPEEPAQEPAAPEAQAAAAVAAEVETIPFAIDSGEGIIAAAEKLSDEQLDAGGDAAVVDAISSATMEAAQAPEAPSAEAPVDAPTPLPEVAQPEHEQNEEQHDPQADAEGHLDLGALLDSHLRRDDEHGPAEGNGAAAPDWSAPLSAEPEQSHVTQ